MMSVFPLLVALAGQTAAPTPSATAAAQPAGTSGEPVNQGQTTYVDLEGGAGYSTNPYLSMNSGNGAGFGRISAHAVHTLVSTRTTTVLSAYAQSMFYTGGLSSSQSFDLNVRHDAAVNEKLHIYLEGDASYDKGGQLDTRILNAPNVPLLPGTTLPPPLLTVGRDFLGVTGRTYVLDLNSGAEWTLSPRDFVDLSAGIDHTVFKAGNVDTRYTVVPVSVGFSRQVSEHARLGGQIAATFNHYSGGSTDGPVSSQVISPEATVQLSLTPTLTFAGDAGVSFSSVDEGNATRHSTGFVGRANLCSTGERTQLCGRVSLQQAAATTAGIGRVVTLAVDYSRRLSEDDTIQFSVSGDRYSNPINVLSRPSFSNGTYFRAAANYSRRIGPRFFGGVDLAARKLTQNGPDPKADLSASLFIRYRLGDVR